MVRWTFSFRCCRAFIMMCTPLPVEILPTNRSMLSSFCFFGVKKSVFMLFGMYAILLLGIPSMVSSFLTRLDIAM